MTDEGRPSYLKDVIVFIPSLNPDDKLLSTVRSLREEGFTRILVLDDGSREETALVFARVKSECGCELLRHPINLGKGRALKTAFMYILNTYPACAGVVTVDADGQHKAKDVAACARALLDHPDSLILGCRDFNESGVPARSRFGNRLTRRVFSFLCGLKVSDTQTGLRGMSKRLMEAFLPVKGERFEYEMNMLIEADERQIPIREVPIETVYIEENRSSHFNPLLDSVRVYSVFTRFILSSLTSFLLDILLFALFVYLLEDRAPQLYIFYATLGARLVSSLFNFLTNKNQVFQYKERSVPALTRYYAICLVVLAGSAFGVYFLHSWFKISEVALKIPVDLLLFVLSFQVERNWVFGQKDKKGIQQSSRR